MNIKEKEKLIEKRKLRGFTQKDMADKLNLEVSSYSRRESGYTKIRIDQWETLAKILSVPLADIYEDDEHQSFTFNDSTIGDYCASNISITIPETLLETLQKYIRKLEEENTELRLLMKR